METVKCSELITENYLRYGRYVNNGRSTVSIDGLKNVERRVLLGVREVASTKSQASSLVCGYCTGHLHPHGDVYPSLVKLVNEGFVEGHGNFGDHLSPPAAMRYTKVKANEEFSKNVFRFVDFVPKLESEFGTLEPEYLPVPVPLALCGSGAMGIGVGLLMTVPAFSPQSLLLARKADNPALLRAPKGLSIVDANLTDIWEKGTGHIQYGMRVYNCKSDADEGRTVSVIEGNPRLFIPDVNKAYEQELEDELVYIRDESVDNFRVIISRVKGIKKINDDQVHEKAQHAATRVFYTKLYVSNGTQAVRIGLREWLNQCWKCYEDAFSDYQADQIGKLEYRIHLYDLIPVVYPLLVKGMATKSISGELNETMETIRDIESKPLRLLRKKDFDAEITKLKADVRAVKNLTAEKSGEDFIKTVGR
jgi:DNA gyrase/topoisomerase IV subunit A